MAYQPPPHIPIPSPSPSSGGSSSSSRFQFLNSPFAGGFGDTTYTKVFVGGLAWETQSETLRHHFEQFGEILEAVVITDKNTGRSKGYGFVTFRDPDSARRACADPTPMIDGRRANCNLASLGRPHPPLPFVGHLRSPTPYMGSVPAPQRAYARGFGFQQPVTYGYQQGLMYPQYGYTPYGPEVAYQQGGVYNPYVGQQYLQVYGVNPSMYQYNQVGQTISTGHGYANLPGHQILPFGGSNITAAAIPPIQTPYPTGMGATVPAQPQFILPAHSPQFVQGSGSDQTAA